MNIGFVYLWEKIDMKRKMTNYIAVLLMVAMVIGCDSSIVFAVENEQSAETIENENNNESKNEESTGEVIEEAKNLPDEVDGMPEDYVLSATEQRIKENISDHDVVNALDNMIQGEDYAENEVICLAKSREHAEMIAEAYGGRLVKYAYGVVKISLADTELTVPEAVEVGADPDNNIPAVEPNYLIPCEDPVENGEDDNSDSLMSAAPRMTTWNDITDPEGDFQFTDPALDPRSENYQWMHDMVNTYGAWGVTTGSDAVKVAVIDSGVLTTHEELSGRVVAVDIGCGTTPQDGHGTHVAGIIAADANDKGGVGIAPGVNIVSIRTANNDGAHDNYNITCAIAYVAGFKFNHNEEPYSFDHVGNRRADIINMSLGGPSYTACMQEAINYAHDAGVTVCAAMGNQYSNTLSYPGAYDNVIAVSAVNEAGYKATFSNYGGWADIAAPGTNIYSAYSGGNDDYRSMPGTSMACPVVAGACALYMSALGHVDPDTMERVLKSSVNKANSSEIGAGIIDASKMFSGDITAPVIMLSAGDDPDIVHYGVAEDAKTVNVSEIIPYDAYIEIKRAQFNGNGSYQTGSGTGSMDREILIYTTDGKSPAVKDGEVTVGEVYDSASPIRVADLIESDADKKKITVKAACITGMGVISKISTMTFTADPSLITAGVATSQNVEIIGVPKSIIAGTSVTLNAKVKPDDFSQKVTWRIKSYENGDLSKATIGETNGILKTDAKQSGTIEIECLASDGNSSTTAKISVIRQMYPVASIGIDKKSATIYSGNDDDPKISGGQNKTVISINALTDNQGNDMIADDSIAHVGFGWTSSNNKIVTLTPLPGDRGVTVTAKAKGSATITCTAQDGSNKKATCTITVIQDVEEISLTGPAYVASGSKATYKANVLPSDANNKKVTWSVTKENGDPIAPEIVSISQSGVVTVSAGCASGKYKVIATAQDGGGVFAVRSFEVSATKASSVAVYVDSAPDPVYQAKCTEKKLANTDIGYLSISSLQLFNKKTTRDVDATKLNLKGMTIAIGADKKTESDITANNIPAWESSNNSIVIVTPSDDGMGATATAVAGAKGTARITCTAQDGSGRKATVNITVAEPADNITVKGQNYIMAGSGATYKATLLPVSANNRKVKWSVTKENGEAVDSGTVSINENTGAVKVEKGTTGSFKVTAAAADLSKVSGYTRFMAIPGKTGFISVSTTDNPQKYCVKTDKNGNVTEARLFNKITTAGVDACSMTLEAFAMDTTENKSGTSIDVDNILDWSTNSAKLISIVPSNDGKSVRITAIPGAKGTATVTVSSLDGSNKKANIKISVAAPVDKIEANGQTFIAQGSNASYKAVVSPAIANNKGIIWSITPKEGASGAAVNEKNGSVSVSKDAYGTFEVKATATDGSGVAGKTEFGITTVKVSSVAVKTDEDGPTYKVVRDKNTGNLKSAQLYTANIGRDGADERVISVYAQEDGVDPFEKLIQWSSSNENVATVTSDDDGKTAEVTGIGSGKATITATAMDGSNKKASFTVNVIVPVSNIVLQPADGIEELIGFGKSAKTLVAYGSAYGNPSEKKVTWDYRIAILKKESYYDEEGNITDLAVSYYDNTDETDEVLKENKLFTVKDGKVTAGSRAVFDKCNTLKPLPPDETETYSGGGLKKLTQYMYCVDVNAVTTDGSGCFAGYQYVIGEATKSIGLYTIRSLYYNGQQVYYVDRINNLYCDINREYDTGLDIYPNCLIYCQYSDGIYYQGTNAPPTISSNNPSVANGYHTGNGNIHLITGNKGKATITIRANDGSNAKGTFTVHVD